MANDSISFTVTAKVESSIAHWIALGLNNQPTMGGGYAVVGWVQPGQVNVTISSRQLIGYGATHSAIPFNAQNYIFANGNCSNAGGVHVWGFNRQVNFQNNIFGIPNIVNGFTHLLWAIGPNAPVNVGDPLQQHLPTYRGLVLVNFFTGQTMPDTAFIPPTASASVLGSALALTIAAFLVLFV